jgi:8-oxo-dGTP pyrophosphatase MutT (NUDIX family)
MTIESGAVGVIHSAGGLLWRDTNHGKELAVIHRARHDDWTLPKGKLKPAESWQEAALREVKEETGCSARLGSFAGSVSYLVNDVPKVVLFWNMTLAGECDFQPSEEVDQVIWLPAPEAVKRLNYAAERAIVTHGHPLPRRSAPRLRFWTGWGSPSRGRLASSLSVYRTELDYLVKQTAAGTEAPRLAWAVAAYKLLEKAEQALAEGDVELGWQCFNTAQRMELFGLDRPALQARAQAVLREAADKLGSWRRQAIEDLLGQSGQPKPDLDAGAVARASQLLHEHYSNVYRKLAIIRQQLGILAVVGLLAAITWAALGLPLAGNPTPAGDSRLVVSAMLFGIMGASVSGIFSLAKGSDAARTPDQLVSFWITLARLAVGAMAALVAYAFLASGLLQIGSPAPGLMLAVAFAAGFSERLVISAVETVAR